MDVTWPGQLTPSGNTNGEIPQIPVLRVGIAQLTTPPPGPCVSSLGLGLGALGLRFGRLEVT